jgi:hypothetical protein
MKASELITQLAALISKWGDKEVAVAQNGCYGNDKVSEVELGPSFQSFTIKS